MGDLQSAGMLSINVLFSNSIQVCTPCYAVEVALCSVPKQSCAFQPAQLHALAQLLLQALGSSEMTASESDLGHETLTTR